VGASPGLPAPLIAWAGEQLGLKDRCQVRPLGGGVGARTFLVGRPGLLRNRSPEAVLRILPNRSSDFAATVLGREARVLGLLGGAVKAPRLLGFDATGSDAGQPALLTSFLPGHAKTLSRDLGSLEWVAMTKAVAGALVDVHRAIPVEDVAVPTVDLGWLEPAALGASAEYAPDPWKGFWRELRDLAAKTEISTGWFIQRDFRVTHLLWRRARSEVTGIVGWERAGYGPRAWDLARARLDLTLQCGGPEPARLVTDFYEQGAREPVGALRFWDLAVGLSAIDALDSWGRGYGALGRADLSPQTLWIRLLDFLRNR
jgi:aminoglycoside phosphotransferase (APT) family kinase protein